MKVVLLTTARSQDPTMLATLKAQLGVFPDDGVEVSVISWHRPRRPLPVTTNLLVGSDVTFSRSARVLDVADPWVTEDLGELDDLGGPDAPGSDHSPGSADSLSLPEPSVRARDAGTPQPVSDLSRVSQARGRRANAVWLAIWDNPTVSRVRNSTKLRKARNKVAPGLLGSQFAAACLRARNVRQEVDAADVVVALDANTHRAAWLLARLHARPAFVVGTAAGKRVLLERAATRP